jgi:hypothetical protein
LLRKVFVLTKSDYRLAGRMSLEACPYSNRHSLA